MKFLTTSLLLFPIILAAQVFPTADGSFWEGIGSSLAGPYKSHQILCGDTLINNVEYKQLFNYYESPGNQVIQIQYSGGIRVEEEMVWYIRHEEESEILLYDFDVEEGDSFFMKMAWNYEDSVEYTVQTIEQIEIAGIQRKKITSQVQGLGQTEIWIEGIGSDRGVTGRGFHALDAGTSLHCYWEGGNFIYTTLEDQANCEGPINCSDLSTSTNEIGQGPWQVFPNPTKDFLIISNQNETYTSPIRLKIFNSSGHLVQQQDLGSGSKFRIPLSNLTAGLYIFELEEREKKLSLQHFKIVIQE